MLKKLSAAVILLFSLAGCKSHTALNYNQDLVKKEQSITDDIHKTEESVKAFFAEQRFDSIAIAGARMENIVDVKLNEIKTQPPPDVKDADDFKKAWIKYFEFIKSVYTLYKEYGKAATSEDREKIMSRIKDLIAVRNVAVSDIQSAQQSFADANGFKIQKQ